jgi:hypothetical protein
MLHVSNQHQMMVNHQKFGKQILAAAKDQEKNVKKNNKHFSIS